MPERKKQYLWIFLVLLMPAILLATTADHSKYPALQKKFKTAPEVTEACLSCHVEAGSQIMSTIHWTWACPKAAKEGKKIGKNNVVNNFCVAVPSNEPRCTSCHIGYGWKDKEFDFTNQNHIDCLVCHDQTGTYKKFPTGAGHPTYEPKKFGGKVWNPPDLNKVAQNVGTPKRNNCGTCHFYGGGGEGVKHADLDMSLYHASRSLDVHMDEDGLNFSCQECHTTREHKVSGRCYSIPAAEEKTFSFPISKDDKHIYCESCHGNEPHDLAKINDHVDKVSCQACHIHRGSREHPTKYYWDWSKAGKFDENGKPIVKKDEDGNIIYHTKKGEFKWTTDLMPEYYWFNGSAKNMLIGDKVDDARPVQINQLLGSYDDPHARIWPVKVHRGVQMYDPVEKTLPVPKLFGKKGSGAYWKSYDWKKAVEAGMNYVDVPFSGEIDWVETEMYWPITHMVAPKEDAVQCQECHTRDDSRLASLGGFYMPGRDKWNWLDATGWVLVLMVFSGTAIHALLRVIMPIRNGSNGRKK